MEHLTITGPIYTHNLCWNSGCE